MFFMHECQVKVELYCTLHQNWIQFYCCGLQTLNIYPSPVYQVLNINWPAFLKKILPTLQSYNWSNGTNERHRLGSKNLGLLSLTLWLTSVVLHGHCVDIMAALGMFKQEFLPPPITPHVTGYTNHTRYKQNWC